MTQPEKAVEEIKLQLNNTYNESDGFPNFRGKQKANIVVPNGTIVKIFEDIGKQPHVVIQRIDNLTVDRIGNPHIDGYDTYGETPFGTENARRYSRRRLRHATGHRI